MKPSPESATNAAAITTGNGILKRLATSTGVDVESLRKLAILEGLSGLVRKFGKESPRGKSLVVVSISNTLLSRLGAVAEGCGIERDDLLRIAVTTAVREFEATGGLPLCPKSEPVLHIEPKLLRRMAELDKDLKIDVQNGHGVAQQLLGDPINDLKDGSWDLFTEGYTFDDPAEAKQTLAKLAAKWKAEDALLETGEGAPA